MRWLALVCLVGCAPQPVAPVYDFTDADVCTVYQEIDEARLIREPDGGDFNRKCPDE